MKLRKTNRRDVRPVSREKSESRLAWSALQTTTRARPCRVVEWTVSRRPAQRAAGIMSDSSLHPRHPSSTRAAWSCRPRRRGTRCRPSAAGAECLRKGGKGDASTAVGGATAGSKAQTARTRRHGGSEWMASECCGAVLCEPPPTPCARPARCASSAALNPRISISALPAHRSNLSSLSSVPITSS